MEGSFLCMDGRNCGDVNGEECVVTFVARLAVLARGEGVNGIRPPAVFVEKRPWWLFSGVAIEGAAIFCRKYQIEWTNECFDRGRVC